MSYIPLYFFYAYVGGRWAPRVNVGKPRLRHRTGYALSPIRRKPVPVVGVVKLPATEELLPISDLVQRYPLTNVQF